MCVQFVGCASNCFKPAGAPGFCGSLKMDQGHPKVLMALFCVSSLEMLLLSSPCSSLPCVQRYELCLQWFHSSITGRSIHFRETGKRHDLYKWTPLVYWRTKNLCIITLYRNPRVNPCHHEDHDDVGQVGSVYRSVPGTEPCGAQNGTVPIAMDLNQLPLSWFIQQGTNEAISVV